MPQASWNRLLIPLHLELAHHRIPASWCDSSDALADVGALGQRITEKWRRESNSNEVCSDSLRIVTPVELAISRSLKPRAFSFVKQLVSWYFRSWSTRRHFVRAFLKRIKHHLSVLDKWAFTTLKTNPCHCTSSIDLDSKFVPRYKKLTKGCIENHFWLWFSQFNSQWINFPALIFLNIDGNNPN